MSRSSRKIKIASIGMSLMLILSGCSLSDTIISGSNVVKNEIVSIFAVLADKAQELFASGVNTVANKAEDAMRATQETGDEILDTYGGPANVVDSYIEEHVSEAKEAEYDVFNPEPVPFGD